LHELIDAAGSVQHRVVGMGVNVDEAVGQTAAPGEGTTGRITEMSFYRRGRGQPRLRRISRPRSGSVERRRQVLRERIVQLDEGAGRGMLEGKARGVQERAV